jgi:hypothetical protein
MRKQLSIIVLLMVVSAAAGFWLGHADVNRPDGGTARPALSGHVVLDGAAVSAGSALLSNSLAVEGNLQMRSLPDGNLALEGNLNVKPH